MNQNDNKLIREIILTDLKKISNPDFTLSTLEKIKELKKDNGLKQATQIDLTFIYPVVGFSILLVLFSIIKVIGSLFEIELMDKILNSTEIISNLFFQPITISLITTFTILFLLDSYLKKHAAKFNKHITGNLKFDVQK